MKRLYSILLLFVLSAVPAVRGQQVTHHANPSEPLAARWAWGQEAARGATGGAWIGYSIRRLMGEHSTISHGGYHADWNGRESLHEVLYGTAPTTAEEAVSDREAVRRAARRALEHRQGPERKVEKDVALLFRLGRGGRIEEVSLTNLTHPFDLGMRPLYWLGPAEDAPSIAFLREHYGRADADLKEDLISAIGIHDDLAAALPFLQGVLTGREDDDIREKAAFWLGQTDDAGALRVLVETVQGDRSGQVREQAVFAISQMEREDATDALIRFARQEGDREVREKAIFWLGQKASEKAVSAIRDAVYDSDDTEVQKQAVFALSQLPKERGIPMLIDVAKTHRNPEVRKQAIFWLGQTGDPRAVDVLVDLVRGQ